MRVTIEHTTAKIGMFKSCPAITLTVEFSSEERSIIDRSGLASYTFFEAPHHPDVSETFTGAFEIEYLLKGKPISFYYTDLAAARADEGRLREALKTMKEVIEANEAPTKSKDTFEL